MRLRHLAPDVPREATPIDEFFDSLAADLGEDAIGIVLSGTGHDGALGLKAIRARGGLTLAQGTDGTAPQHSGMPNSAIATGAVDLIVPVQDMPGLMVRIKDRHEAGVPASASALQTDTCAAEHLRDTVGARRPRLQRVQRGDVPAPGAAPHAGAGHCRTCPLTSSRLEEDREEAMLLFRDLLIGVTTFFRDAGAFAAVKQVVLPRLFEGKGAADQVRVWVPGCATGEEAYSLAILLREHMDGLSDLPKVQVFATDIDEPAIGTARAGRYPATLLDGLSPERRDRFFNRHENSYVVAKEIRDLCTFSAHSLVRDPPFSRMNLVSCRNLLIYMDAELQAAVIPAFHYSLLPGGVLLLGSAETVARHDGLFAPLEKEHRIFLRRDGPSPHAQGAGPLMRQRAPSTSARAAAGPAERADRLAALPGRREQPRAGTVRLAVRGGDGRRRRHALFQPRRRLPAAGARSAQPQRVRHGPARPAPSPARRAAERGRDRPRGGAGRPGRCRWRRSRYPGCGAAAGAGAGPALPDRVQGERPGQVRACPGRESDGAGADSVAAEVDRELRDTREQLQSLAEEHETALEELRSSNEELHSVNEELQSSNEELETSKEEIQSVNEELHTVNAQLSMKVDELDRANSDLRNLFESTRVATVFLDQHMVIRAFTPEVASIYNLIPSDRGRPLTDIVSRLDYDGLARRR